MIKLDIINRVADKTGVPKMKAEQAVDALFHSMKAALTRGERIELRGFGVFVVKPRKRGVGRNPRTGEEVAIPSGKTIRFKPGKELQAHEDGEPLSGEAAYASGSCAALGYPVSPQASISVTTSRIGSAIG